MRRDCLLLAISLLVSLAFLIETSGYCQLWALSYLFGVQICSQAHLAFAFLLIRWLKLFNLRLGLSLRGNYLLLRRYGTVLILLRLWNWHVDTFLLHNWARFFCFGHYYIIDR